MQIEYPHVIEFHTTEPVTGEQLLNSGLGVERHFRLTLINAEGHSSLKIKIGDGDWQPITYKRVPEYDCGLLMALVAHVMIQSTRDG